MIRSRLFLLDYTVAGQTQTISISQQLPYNCELIQWLITFGAVPTTPGNFVIERHTTIPGVLGTQDINLITLDPVVEGLTQRICNPELQFKRGDVVSADWPNADDIDSFVELVFREAR